MKKIDLLLIKNFLKIENIKIKKAEIKSIFLLN